MHLKSASVDLDGNLIATGTLVHPTDDGGNFHSSGLDCLKVDRETMRIVRCTAARDTTGFFQAEEVGGVLHVPEPLASQIKSALRFGVQEPVTMALLSHQGSLASSSSRIRNFTQPLSDWRLRIEEVDGNIEVIVSAALHSPYLREWLTSEKNFWTEQTDARVETRFTINAATRTACFGAYIPGRDGETQGREAQPDAPGGGQLDLERAPVGPVSQFGIRDGRWVYFSSSSQGPDHSLSFTEHRDVRRLKNGFLSYGRCVWPRIRVQGLSLSSVASALAEEPVRISGGGIAISLSHDGPEGWSEDASDAAVEFRLHVDGLSIDYFLTVAHRPIEGCVVLPWELLILRYPALGSRRGGILSAA